MDPELEAKENQEFQNSEIGAVEVPIDMTERMAEQTKADLYELPNELRTAFDRVAPGLGAEVYSRAQELSGDLLRQLQDSQERGNATQYGSFNDNTTVSSERESMNFGEINRMVAALKILAEQLEDQARRQAGDTRVIDLDKLDGGDERAVPEFWYLLTGEREYGVGHETQVGEYTLNAQQSQEAQGPGSETRKLIIRKNEAPQEAPLDNIVSMDDFRQKKAEEAGSVLAAEKPEEIPETGKSNVVFLDSKRKIPATTYGRNSEDSPGEQNRAAS